MASAFAGVFDCRNVGLTSCKGIREGIGGGLGGGGSGHG